MNVFITLFCADDSTQFNYVSFGQLTDEIDKEMHPVSAQNES